MCPSCNIEILTDSHDKFVVLQVAAVRPDTRFRYICAKDSVVNVIRAQQTATSFGIDKIALKPMAVSAFLLPPAKICYGNNAIVDPKLNGSWTMDRTRFSSPAPGANCIGFGLLVVGGRSEPGPPELAIIQSFLDNLIQDAKNAGITLTSLGRPRACSGRNDRIAAALEVMKSARLVVVVMMDDDCYGDIKLVADKMGLPSQCCKFKKVEKMPRGYGQNLMLKINTKLGGTNHTLVSRLPKPHTAPVFQQPPASLSWVFDDPCMLVGIDVSHGETSSSMESVAAVVASMDGSCAQYAAHISVQTAGQEIVASLEASMLSLLTTFRCRNAGKMPSCIIVYRDGVGEGQFSQVTRTELSAIRGAVELMGFTEDAVKISIVICQKGHHTRLVYEDSAPGVPMTYINPCPGLCVDASGGANSISSGHLNEFYLNSHVAIQGTAKPCKYTLVHDEIGFKISELELMTYWLTYLYCRANKSVSYASPAYYAHWASKRGKSLCAAGGSPADLLQISQKWGEANRTSPMFFI
jgi:Piwi domain